MRLSLPNHRLTPRLRGLTRVALIALGSTWAGAGCSPRVSLGDDRHDGAPGACTPGQDQTCNESGLVSTITGKCNANGTCTCNSGYTVSPQSGRCTPIGQTDGGLDGAARVCTPGKDQTCNDDSQVSAVEGHCNANGTCTCTSQYTLNPATGRCTWPGHSDAGLPDSALGVCTFGQDQTCNDDPLVSELEGHCKSNGTCTCNSQYALNPATGRCTSGSCPSGQVCLRSDCVETTRLGCGATCDALVASSCPTDWSCDNWAAAPTCGISAAASPACVRENSFSTLTRSAPLRITPTSGSAGKSVTLYIAGSFFPLVDGVFGYRVRFGAQEKLQDNGQLCHVVASFTPPSIGIFPVEVSQYSGTGPWVLAGFYVATGATSPSPTVQPGYPCSTIPGALLCAQAAPYACSCSAGRCQCK